MDKSTLFSWLATYLLHSTLLIAVVWSLCRGLRALPETLREALWRAALAVPVVTATAALATEFEPAAGRVEVVAPAAPAVVPALQPIDPLGPNSSPPSEPRAIPLPQRL